MYVGESSIYTQVFYQGIFCSNPSETSVQTTLLFGTEHPAFIERNS